MWHVLTLLVFLSPCFAPDLLQCPGGSCPIPRPDTQLPNQSRAEKYPEFVIVEAGSSKGSGTCFYTDSTTNKSYVFTVAHVVQKGMRGTVVLYDGRRLPYVCVDSSSSHNRARIGSFSEGNFVSSGFWCYLEPTQTWVPEWSVLEVDGIIERSRLVRSPEDPISVGDKAYVIGWAGGRRFEIRLGSIIRLERWGLIVIDVPAIPGMSGGAILRQNRTSYAQDVHDELIGLISATDGRNTIGVPISYVIAKIEQASWLPWRRFAEENAMLQRQYNELQDELARLREELARIRGSTPPAPAPSKPEEEPKPEPPKPEPSKPPQTQPDETVPLPQLENIQREWSTLKRWGIAGIVLIITWLILLTIFGQGFLFSNPLVRLITRLIPGRTDDVIVALLASGEQALASYLSEKLGVSKKRYQKMQETVKQLRNIASKKG